MTLEEAILERRSRRQYLGTPLDETVVAKLQEQIAHYNKPGSFRMALVTGDGKGFRGFLKSYGMLSGVNDYIGLIADSRDETATRQLGYYGELIMLHAVTLGLGTCWVGGSFRKSDMPFTLGETEQLVCTITIGNVTEENSFRERLIHKITHRKTKQIADMVTTDGAVPAWFTQGMESVQWAPSAMNKQPVRFTYRDGSVGASIENRREGLYGTMTALDLGIARLHFELGAGGGTWGDDGIFRREADSKATT
jgi:nitroreductase